VQNGRAFRGGVLADARVAARPRRAPPRAGPDVPSAGSVAGRFAGHPGAVTRRRARRHARARAGGSRRLASPRSSRRAMPRLPLRDRGRRLGGASPVEAVRSAGRCGFRLRPCPSSAARGSTRPRALASSTVGVVRRPDPDTGSQIEPTAARRRRFECRRRSGSTDGIEHGAGGEGLEQECGAYVGTSCRRSRLSRCRSRSAQRYSSAAASRRRLARPLRRSARHWGEQVLRVPTADWCGMNQVRQTAQRHRGRDLVLIPRTVAARSRRGDSPADGPSPVQARVRLDTGRSGRRRQLAVRGWVILAEQRWVSLAARCGPPRLPRAFRLAGPCPRVPPSLLRLVQH
jgi:hypothetical protein